MKCSHCVISCSTIISNFHFVQQSMVLYLSLIIYFLPPLPLTYYVVLLLVASFVVALPLFLKWSSFIFILDLYSSRFFIFLNSPLEYLWFLNFHLLLLNHPIGPYFILLILAQCLYACRAFTYEIYEGFWYISSLYSYFLSSAFWWANFFSNSLEKYFFATSHHSSNSTLESFILLLVFTKV